MMHAVLLLWQREVKELEELISFFDGAIALYIHVDENVNREPDKLRSLQELHPCVKIWSRTEAGDGMGMLEAQLFLLEQAVADGGFEYIHFMSDGDFPVKPLEEIADSFIDQQGCEFIECIPLPDKLFPSCFPRLYGGSNAMSITGECARYIVGHRREHSPFFERLRHTLAPEEVYFHTVIMNSPFAAKVTGDNLRLEIRDEASDSLVTLTEKHWWKVATTDKLIARKVDREKSALLLRNLYRYILRPDSVSIADSGYWTSSSLKGHYFDNSLAEALLNVLRLLPVKTIADFGCGPGWYVALLRRNGYDVQGYDGNPAVEEMSSGFFDDGFCCLNVDLTEELEAEEPFDMVMSLEVGEHIPQTWETVFLDNLVRNARSHILLSWALDGPFGEGHVNCHTNEYIVERMKERGYTLNKPISRYLRMASTLWWFKDTIMFFEKR